MSHSNSGLVFEENATSIYADTLQRLFMNKLVQISLTVSAVVTFLSLATTARAQASLNYLGDLGGDYSVGYGINDSGQVVGQAATSAGSPVPTVSFLYSPATGMENLGNLGGADGAANAINDAGQVVGWSEVDSQDVAYVYSDGTGMQPVPGTQTGGYGTASGINSSGQIVGTYTPNASMGQYATQGFLYTPGSGLIGLPSVVTHTAAINNSGEIVGYATTGNTSQAFIYSAKAGLQEIGLLPGYTTSGASAINNSGEVVGTLGTAGEASRAFLYSSSTGIINLGTLGNGLTSEAAAVNNLGDVVGNSTITNLSIFEGATVDAFLYTPTTGMQDLNLLYSSLLVSNSGIQAGFTRLIEANGINDEGQIVGEGIYDNGTTSYQAAFVLDTQAAPEPSTWVLVAIGFVSLMWMRRKRLSRSTIS